MCAKRSTLTASMPTISGSVRTAGITAVAGLVGEVARRARAYLQLCIERGSCRLVVLFLFFRPFGFWRSLVLLPSLAFPTCLRFEYCRLCTQDIVCWTPRPGEVFFFFGLVDFPRAPVGAKDLIIANSSTDSLDSIQRICDTRNNFCPATSKRRVIFRQRV